MSDEIKKELDIVETLFDHDLKFGEIILKDFSPKKEFEFMGLYAKFVKKIKNVDELDFETIMENVDFETCEKISKWMDSNTNVCDILHEGGDIMNKVLVFFYMFFDLKDYKENIKKKSTRCSKVEVVTEPVNNVKKMEE